MPKELWTIGRLLQWTEQYFRNKGVESSRLDGEVLLSHILGVDRIYLYTHYDQPLTKEELDKFRPLVIERGDGFSVAAVIGKKEFMGLTFNVSKDVLIPRPDTETIVEDLLSVIPKDSAPYILDVCTGPGTILYSLLHYVPAATGLGLDISKDALQIAARNREDLKLMDRAKLWQSDMFTALHGDLPTYENAFDVIVSNPPYIPTADMEDLAIEVKNEPQIALDGGADGLDFYRILLQEAPRFLKSGGTLAFEIGINQAEDIAALAEETGAYGLVTMTKDLGGIVRALRWVKK
ncbi:MAG: peptide chain release factor N(5)-glutamine methyltransferase [Veillonella sp.]|uniref:peptide chain release factor N(5)-glutamine methyltransferase n=1 Tax=Veillonella sp. TaxID=1926307 RepID=UPI0025F21C50|nr:peptide chain release factor N(5)-glutamine methyltransferase [Veillonella sp.]MBS4913767.1 peptide chain release factor N(5)-glutamine methyltransferase [Veillonella sp.]